jgi:hypothetical protein
LKAHYSRQFEAPKKAWFLFLPVSWRQNCFSNKNFYVFSCDSSYSESRTTKQIGFPSFFFLFSSVFH